MPKTNFMYRVKILKKKEEEEDNASKKKYKDNAKKSGDEPIYHGHSMSVKVSVLLILLYCITPHGISGSQLQDLLTLDLIALHCMEVHPWTEEPVSF